MSTQQGHSREYGQTHPVELFSIQRRLDTRRATEPGTLMDKDVMNNLCNY